MEAANEWDEAHRGINSKDPTKDFEKQLQYHGLSGGGEWAVLSNSQRYLKIWEYRKYGRIQ